MDKSTEKELLIDGKKITSEVKLIPEEPTGEVIVSFELDARYIKEILTLSFLKAFTARIKSLQFTQILRTKVRP